MDAFVRKLTLLKLIDRYIVSNEFLQDPSLAEFPGAASSRFRAKRGYLKEFEEFYLKAKAIIWPWLSYMCHLFSMHLAM
jgi:hypothetical protein